VAREWEMARGAQEVRVTDKMTPWQETEFAKLELDTKLEHASEVEIPENAVCEHRLHYHRHQAFVERYESAGLRDEIAHPTHQLWTDMWRSAEEFARSAYRLKREGVRFGCARTFESNVIQDAWEVMQNKTLHIYEDSELYAHSVMSSQFLIALRVEMRILNEAQRKFGPSDSIAEEILWRLENAQRVFGIKPEEVLMR